MLNLLSLQGCRGQFLVQVPFEMDQQVKDHWLAYQ
jgi:hypothetical protein